MKHIRKESIEIYKKVFKEMEKMLNSKKVLSVSSQRSQEGDEIELTIHIKK